MTTKATLLKTIKLQCSECMGSDIARKGELDQTAANLIPGCSASECCLFPYRMGKDPWPARKGNSDSIKKAQMISSVRQRKA